MENNQDNVNAQEEYTVSSFPPGSPQKEFTNDLRKIFVTYKKCQGLSVMLTDCFEKSSDPFFASLSIAYNSFDYNQSKPSSLTYTVLETFASWIKPRADTLNHLLTRNIKQNAFKVASGQRNKTIMLQIINTYQLKEINFSFINNIRDMLMNHQYKEACELVKIFSLEENFDIYDFIVPLYLQDKLNVIDEFLTNNGDYQIAFLGFLDSLVIEHNLSSRVSKLISDLKVPEIPVNILCKLYNVKALNRYIKRLLSDFGLSKDVVPNFSRRSDIKTLSYLVHKRFGDKSITEESFRELVVDLVKSNNDIAKEFLAKLSHYGSNSEVIYWCQFLNVPIADMPTSVQDHYESVARGGSASEIDSPKDDDWEELTLEEYHVLSLPPTAIKFVCDEVQLLSMLNSELICGYPQAKEYKILDHITSSESCQRSKGLLHPKDTVQSSSEGTASVVTGSVSMVSGGASLVSGAAALVAGGVARIARSSSGTDSVEAIQGPEQPAYLIPGPDSSLVGPGGASLVALDCEWKPSVGRGKTDLSLLQLATSNSIYILDMISLTSCQQHYDHIISNLFNNPDILKIGFSMQTDMLYLSSYFDCDYSNFGCNLLDLADLWFKLTTEYNFEFLYSDESQENSNSLSRLVFLCLGKNLDKKERFSNWELRPLRESQIQYAALDSFCLIEIYNVLRYMCIDKGLPFDDIICEVVQKYSEKISKKKKKLEENLHSSAVKEKEIKVLNEEPISVDCVSLICDKMVVGLAKKLRRCGISTDVVEPRLATEELIKKALIENKVILVKGHSYAKMKEALPPNLVYKIKTWNPDSQFIEVLNYFNFAIRNEDVFSRCLECNSIHMKKCSREDIEFWHKTPLEVAPLQPSHVPAGYEDTTFADDYDDYCDDYDDDDYLSAASLHPVLKPVTTKFGCPIKADVPECVLKRVSSYHLCESCGKIYWNEGQFDQILGMLNSSFNPP